jgi:glutathione S-transferase
MKLFYSPGTCSLSPHIVLYEGGFPFTAERVDLTSKRTAGGLDFLQINSKGYVPALQLDDGALITEGPAIVQYLADQRPESRLLPRPGTLERVRALEWLNFITAELHKGFKPLFQTNAHESCKTSALEHLAKRLTWLDGQLDGREFLMDRSFSAADAYCFTVLSWVPYARMSLDPWPNLQSYVDRVSSRAAVRQALKAGGMAYRAPGRAS